MGSDIKAMQLPPKSFILEFGPGWGNTSLALAQMGSDVTAIDIEPRYLQILNERAQRMSVQLTTQQGDFFSVRTMERKFDAVLFYECFHHCHDHLALLDELPRVLRPGGKLMLAGETIIEALPYDWGLNPNGEALLQIMQHGWFELAFRESYIMRTLQAKGWETTRIDAPCAAGIVFKSHRKH